MDVTRASFLCGVMVMLIGAGSTLSFPSDPCDPSPCGPNARCSGLENNAVCKCLSGYSGSPPSCRPECVMNSDCERTKSCVNQKCIDPCPDACGEGATCVVVNYAPTCSCPPQTTGDPFVGCKKIPGTQESVSNPCVPSPCGTNSKCTVIINHPVCSCITGSPPSCRPDCTMDSDCERTEGCLNLTCVDPCPGACGKGATCEVYNHRPTCRCPPLTTGEPFSECKKIPVEELCTKASPCGPHSQCDYSEGRVNCSCVPPNIGTPPHCRPACEASTDCAHYHACVNQTCVDPCPGVCSKGAVCQVLDHTAVCTCPPLTTGDPNVECKEVPAQPCDPSPCGQHSACEVKEGKAVCSCATGNVGSPPSCTPECTQSSDCAWNHACIRNRCVDPCTHDVCGKGAACHVINHVVACSCSPLHQGDPYVMCREI